MPDWTTFLDPMFPFWAHIGFYEQKYPGAKGDNVYDGYRIDYSHDPIKWSLVAGSGDVFENHPNDVSKYATIIPNGQSCVVEAKKALPKDATLILVARTTIRGEEAAIAIHTIAERALDVDRNYSKEYSFIAINPRASLLGWGVNYKSDHADDTPIANEWRDVVFREALEQWMTKRKHGTIAWCNLQKIDGEYINVGSSMVRMKLIFDGFLGIPLEKWVGAKSEDGYSDFTVVNDSSYKGSGWESVWKKIGRGQPFLVVLAEYFKGVYEGSENCEFDGPFTVAASGVPYWYSKYPIGNDHTFILQTNRGSYINRPPTFSSVSNTLKQLRGDGSQETEKVPESEKGRWDYEEHNILNDLGKKPEDVGLSEDIVLYSFSDGRTGIDMVVDVKGGSGEGANSGGSNASALSAGNAAAAAGEIEWIYPDIPGAEEVSVIYGDGTPVSSDFSLYRDKILEQSEKASSGAGTSRSAAARPKLAPIRLNFAVDSNAFDDLELLGFNYKMKGSDEVYSVSMQGTGVNGGISFKDESKNGGQKDPAANSGGGGCNGGFAGLLALFAAALPLCAIKRGRS